MTEGPMSTYQSPLSVLVKGAIAGAAGTAIMSAVMERAPDMVQKLPGMQPIEPPAPPPDPDAPTSPTEELAERVAGGVAQTELAPEARARAGEAIHWGYGAAWGAYYAVFQSTFRLPHLLHGTWLGTLVLGVAMTLVPRLGLVPPPDRQQREQLLVSAASHLVYGWSTAIVYAILNLGRRG